MPQHLKAVEAAVTVGMARTEGVHLGSQSLIFEPHGIRSGEFQFDIGTAGSTSLVLQTILLPLSFAKEPSSVTVKGGKHVLSSPCFHYLDLHWIRYMREIGFDLQLDMELAGGGSAGRRHRSRHRPVGGSGLAAPSDRARHVEKDPRHLRCFEFGPQHRRTPAKPGFAQTGGPVPEH